MEKYARVYIYDASFPIRDLFDYRIPSFLISEIYRGRMVMVPFGTGNHSRCACVEEIHDTTTIESPKDIIQCLPKEFSLSIEQLSLCHFLSDYTLCTMGEAIRAISLPGLVSNLQEKYILNPELAINEPLFQKLSKQQEWSKAMIRTQFTADEQKLLKAYLKKGYVYNSAVPSFEEKIKIEWMYSLNQQNDTLKLRSEKQKQILHYLKEHGTVSEKEIKDALLVSKANLDALVDKGCIVKKSQEVQRNPYQKWNSCQNTSKIQLSEKQEEIYQSLLNLYTVNEPKASLLYGITGSGKTSVILAMIDKVLADNKSVIMLVPEIALTPQTVQIFCKRYGDTVSVIHSSLSKGERFDAWRQIKRSSPSLVIGTRSAIFAPVKDLGLIVIDEEHESTYKSEQNPKYHARDVAAFLCKQNNALLLLASATPSIESFYKAQNGIYHLLTLTERYGNAVLPTTEIVDMRKELSEGNLSPLSRPLLDSMQEALQQKKQAILFLNRRGYATVVVCMACGEAIMCPHCSVSMTYHSHHGEYLLCHTCGFQIRPVPRVCPHCQSKLLSRRGYGTEKIEKELEMNFREAKVLRMDADTTQSREDYEKILDAFRNHEADILLGTQMVTKGHDFPFVTVVGVVNADTALHAHDFRASETTFSLLTQVIGRAGRSKYPGKAFIQTYLPTNSTILLSARQDYPSFYQQEIEIRRAMLFPPFCHMVQISLTSRSEEQLKKAANEIAISSQKILTTEFQNIPMQAYGPFESQVYKSENRFHMRMIFKCQNSKLSRQYFRKIEEAHYLSYKDVAISIDCNPFFV